MSRFRGHRLASAGVLVAIGSASAQCTPEWATGFGSPPEQGFNDAVEAFATWDDDGPGPHPTSLYAGGWFNNAGGMSVGHIARWTGAAWEALGSGTDGQYVSALAVYNGQLYASGNFNGAGGVPSPNVARWNGTSWSAAGLGLSGRTYSLAVYQGSLYAGGESQWTGPNFLSTKVARWNGSVWTSVGPAGSINQEVYALLVHNDGSGEALFAGGFFAVAGNFVAKWNGFQWQPLGIGVNSTVYALASFDEDGAGPNPPRLFAGGYFDNAGGVTVNRIARWDGAGWSALNGGIGGVPSPFIYGLAVHDDGAGPALYAGGDFATIGGLSTRSIAKWNGMSFSPLDTGLGGSFPWIFTLASFDDGNGPALWAGGTFEATGSHAALRIGKWGCQPVVCYPDCDTSGVLNVNDYICFQTKFALGDPYADCDGNGVRNVNDYICFQTSFALGC